MKDNKISFDPFPTLITERLTLRRSGSKDVSDVYFLRTDEEINRYVKRQQPTDLKAAKEFITKINKGIDANENIYWSITLTGVDEMIGAISLWQFSQDKYIAEVGYDLKPTFQGQGYMSEALTAVLHYGFEKLHLKEITAYTHKENKPSIKLLTTHGFGLKIGAVDPDVETNIIFSILKRSN